MGRRAARLRRLLYWQTRWFYSPSSAACSTSLFGARSSEQARRQAMLGGVKRNDRVVTIGGVYGVVSNVNREADEVTIRVDESTNTKLRVTLSSIGRILGDEPSDDAAKK